MLLKWFSWVIFYILLISFVNSTAIRNKRYVAFPEGASFSIAMCMTDQTLIPAQIFTEGVNWGIAYQLPNASSITEANNYKKHIVQRRQRREVYNNLEFFINKLGFPGRSCIYRALCEAPRFFNYRGASMIEKILYAIFRFPLDSLNEEEPDEHRLYHWAYRRSLEQSEKSCSTLFSKCKFSLLEYILQEFT